MLSSWFCFFLFFAYNAYSYHQLSSAEGAYKLAGIPGDEKLIAVYHDENFWQFATYNPKARELKVYYLSQGHPLDFRIKKTKTVKTPLNYSPLALDLNQLKQYKPHSKALLFKTLGWKYNSQINGSYWANLSEIIKLGEKCYRIYGIGSSDKMWIRSKKVCTASTFVGEMRCYGSVGIEGLLVFPAYKSSRLLWLASSPARARVATS